MYVCGTYVEAPIVFLSARNVLPNGFHRIRRGNVERGAETDRREPPGWHCGWWATSPIPFYELRIGATMELGRSGRPMM